MTVFKKLIDFLITVRLFSVAKMRASPASRTIGFVRAWRRDARSLARFNRPSVEHGARLRTVRFIVLPTNLEERELLRLPLRHEPSRHAININVRDRMRGTVTNDSSKSLFHSRGDTVDFKPGNFFDPADRWNYGDLRSIRWIPSKRCKCRRTKLLRRRQIYIWGR